MMSVSHEREPQERPPRKSKGLLFFVVILNVIGLGMLFAKQMWNDRPREAEYKEKYIWQQIVHPPVVQPEGTLLRVVFCVHGIHTTEQEGVWKEHITQWCSRNTGKIHDRVEMYTPGSHYVILTAEKP